MRLENHLVLVEISDVNGQIINLYDKQRNRAYIQKGQELAVFKIASTGEMEEAKAVFSVLSSTSKQCHLQWEMNQGTLKASVSLLKDGVSFQSKFINKKNNSIRAFEYPIVGPLINYQEKGYLAHSYATGVLFQNPQSYLPEKGGLRYTPYPEGFSGATMQFFTYYEQDRGGVYFAATDGEGHQKWLNSYTQKGELVASHMTGFEKIGAGTTIEMPYEFHIRFIGEGGWQEGAQLYKPWAMEQSWSRRGRAEKRNNKEKATWLLEEVGFSTFGINAGSNRSKWLNQYRKDLDAKAFHILGPDWTHVPQTFWNDLPGDLEDWLPTKFNKENLANIRENGDYYAPFEFDFLVSLNKSNPEKLQGHMQKFPSPSFSHDAYGFTMLCPAEPFTKTFHREKNLQMMKEGAMDAMYYDISANNLIKICLSEDHHHTPGGGWEITKAYQEIYEDTQQALIKESQKYIPLGTEMINETLLGQLDYYQARAWGQPASTLETWPFREQMHNGLAQMIPLFDYVYHELGVVRLDGWGKLVEEVGELFYYNVAKIYQWGGLYEINHEYSAMEELEGEINSPQEHYFIFDELRYSYSPKRAKYLKQFAKARTGKANPYWSYGKMITPPIIPSESCSLSWYHYNHGQQDSSYKAKGNYKVPGLMVSAFEGANHQVGIFITNVSNKEMTVTLPLKEMVKQYGGKRALLYNLAQNQETLITDFGILDENSLPEETFLANSRELYMLEII